MGFVRVGVVFGYLLSSVVGCWDTGVWCWLMLVGFADLCLLVGACGLD